MLLPQQILPKERFLYFGATFCGSRVTCNPAPTDTDQDIVLLAIGDRLYEALVADGWVLCGTDEGDEYEYSEGWGEKFTAYRKGEYNVIVTKDIKFYDQFMLATALCKHLNLLNKEHRVVVFKAILYGRVPSMNDPLPATPV